MAVSNSERALLAAVGPVPGRGRALRSSGPDRPGRKNICPICVFMIMYKRSSRPDRPGRKKLISVLFVFS